MMTATGHEVGKTYHSHYWRQTYKVLAAHEGGSITVQWADGRQTEHRTDRDPRDEEVA